MALKICSNLNSTTSVVIHVDMTCGIQDNTWIRINDLITDVIGETRPVVFENLLNLLEKSIRELFVTFPANKHEFNLFNYITFYYTISFHTIKLSELLKIN